MWNVFIKYFEIVQIWTTFHWIRHASYTPCACCWISKIFDKLYHNIGFTTQNVTFYLHYKKEAMLKQSRSEADRAFGYNTINCMLQYYVTIQLIRYCTYANVISLFVNISIVIHHQLLSIIVTSSIVIHICMIY